MSKKATILLHLPAYRDPELIPTIKDALDKAKYPKRIHFGICRQFDPNDGFDDLSEYKDDKRFKIYECHYTEAKGLPWARAIINEQLLTNKEDQFIHIWKQYEALKKPYSWRVWPHSKSQGWMEKIEQVIQYE